MNGQHTSSIAHKKTIEAGATIVSVENFGEGDNQQTVVFYDSGLSPVMYDNSGATKIEKLDKANARVRIDGEWHNLGVA